MMDTVPNVVINAVNLYQHTKKRSCILPQTPLHCNACLRTDMSLHDLVVHVEKKIESCSVEKRKENIQVAHKPLML